MVREPLLDLIKNGLGRGTELPVITDWNILLELALDQGVAGITLDAIKEYINDHPNTILIEDQDQQTTLLMKWYGMVNLTTNRYLENKKVIGKLSHFYEKCGIPMMLLKGYGLSLNYPIPEHQPSGDIDIYLFGKCKRADSLFSECTGVEIDNSHHHHSVFSLDKQTVENHYDFINPHSHRYGNKIETHFKSLAREKGDQIMQNVYLPSPLLELEFTARHTASHFASGELKVRQILDWILLAEKKLDKIDWISFWRDVKWMGMLEFVSAMVDIAVTYLGSNKELFHMPNNIKSDLVLADKILEDTLHPLHSELTNKPPKGVLVYLCWIIRRWWLNRWKHSIVYSDSLLATFFSQIISHICKPSSLYNTK